MFLQTVESYVFPQAIFQAHFLSPVVFHELAQHAFKVQGYVLGSL